MRKQFETENAEETKLLGRDLAKSLQGGEVVLLIGEIGAGKTTFVQGMADALDIRRAIKSPTYTIVNEHKTHHKKSRRWCTLMDIVCLGQVFLKLGIDLHCGRENTVIAIEWPEFSF